MLLRNIHLNTSYFQGDDIVRRLATQSLILKLIVLNFQFNRAIRLKASVLGYLLNQKGLFGNVICKPSDRRIKTEAGE